MKRKLLVLCVGLFAVSALAQTQEVNLIARWSFDEGAGTNTLDSSGHGFHGILEGEPLPVWTNGLSGWALTFDGEQNQVTVTNAPGLTPTNAMSVSAWVKAASGTTGEIIAKWSTNGLSEGSFILSLTNGIPRFDLRLNGKTQSVLGGFGRTDGQWHFVAGTYDGTQMAVYWDMTLAGRSAATGLVEFVDAPVLIGFLKGTVDEVALYNRSISASEVTRLFNADRDGDGVTDYWTANYGRSMAKSSIAADGTTDSSAAGATENTGTGITSQRTRGGGRIWYVNNRTGHNGNHGRDISAPKKDIGAAVQLSGDGDVIEVAEGEYLGQFLGHGQKTVILRPKGKVVLK